MVKCLNCHVERTSDVCTACGYGSDQVRDVVADLEDPKGAPKSEPVDVLRILLLGGLLFLIIGIGLAEISEHMATGCLEEPDAAACIEDASTLFDVAGFLQMVGAVALVAGVVLRERRDPTQTAMVGPLSMLAAAAFFWFLGSLALTTVGVLMTGAVMWLLVQLLPVPRSQQTST